MIETRAHVVIKHLFVIFFSCKRAMNFQSPIRGVDVTAVQAPDQQIVFCHFTETGLEEEGNNVSVGRENFGKESP